MVDERLAVTSLGLPLRASGCHLVGGPEKARDHGGHRAVRPGALPPEETSTGQALLVLDR